MVQNPRLFLPESVRARLCEGLDELLGDCFGPALPVTSVSPLRDLLEALPLDSVEFSLAKNRLANAEHYLKVGEYGAARFELRLLRQSLEL
jgi:hypothetical protein